MTEPTYPGVVWAGVSPNRSVRNGTVRCFIVHHTASTTNLVSLRDMFMRENERNVSPNWLVGADGSVTEIVPPDEWRAWTTGIVDHEAVTVETQNTSDDPEWGVSNRSHEAISHLVAWASERYGFQIDRDHVFGHREVSEKTNHTPPPTLCPGPSMDVDYIVSRAREIRTTTGETMAIYQNGRIPLSQLVQRPARGGSCWMMPAMAVRFDYLVRLGQERHGWTPEVSGPDDAYRSIGRQEYYWDTLPYPQAAAPGTSSHGGVYNGRDSGAIDIWNWGDIGVGAWYSLSRDAGFEPGFFSWEPWHIIDWEPWVMPAGLEPEPDKEPKEEDMAAIIGIRREANNAAYVIVPGNFIKHVPNASEENLTKWAAPGLNFQPFGDADLGATLWNLGFPELGGNTDRLPTQGEYHWKG